MSVDSGDVAMLVLLDLSAAFDTIDHDKLVQRLRDEYGLSSSVLQWFISYSLGRTQSVKIHDTMSESKLLTCGVPQGSVLGPILFTMYTRPLGKVIAEKELAHHLYADGRFQYCRS